MKKTLLSLAISAALGLASTAASAVVFEDFKVDTTGYTSILGPLNFTADKMTGNYVEVISFDGAGNFYVAIKWQAGQFVADDGTNPLDVADTSLGLDYGLYSPFNGYGTVSAGGGSATFTLGGGAYKFWLDNKSLTTTFTAPVNGALPWTRGNAGDDVELLYGDAVAGSGNLNTSCSGGINCGSFGQTQTVNQTIAGSNFFYWPDPFYTLSFASGQLNSFVLAGTQTINGSLDLVFKSEPVPEPGILALLGAGLLGLGAMRLRKQA